MAVMNVYLDFIKDSDLFRGVKTFVFSGPESFLPDGYAKGKRGNLNISRSINKNLIQAPLPVSTYNDGGLAIDIGMTDDTFTLDFETYSWYEYRLLASLIKCNTGVLSGTFHFNDDSFYVAVRQSQFSFDPGQSGNDSNDVHVKFSITLTIINRRFIT